MRNADDTETGTKFFDARKAKSRGRLENGERYFAGDWLVIERDTYDVSFGREIKNFEWDENAAKAYVLQLNV
jgi:hypothetical protein